MNPQNSQPNGIGMDIRVCEMDYQSFCTKIIDNNILYMPERRAWNAEQDKILKELRQEMQITKWSVIAKRMADEYNMPDRTGKQCRQRYHNHLDSTILRTQWSPEEEQYLYQLHDEIGNKWAIIAQKLPGRTDNCVKNHFYSKMRKAIRKLNKTIYQYFKKEIKEIKMTVLYKIIEATDERFKLNPNVQLDISDKCCKLKNVLLTYSNDNSNIENDIEKLGQLAREIHEFSSRYRRKPKKTRRPSAQGTDLLKLPKFQHKIKSTSQADQQESEYSMVISHQCDDDQDLDSAEVNPLPKTMLESIKEVDDLKESTNSKLEILQPIIQIKQALIRPPSIVGPLGPLNNARAHIEESDKVEQFLKNQGVLENSLQFSGNLRHSGAFKHIGLRVPSLKGDQNQSMDQQFGHGHNFLSQSIEKMRISDMNFDVEFDQQNRLFISN